MQFYLNGYAPGDPDIREAAPGIEMRPAGLPEAVDVLIVGSGPAGAVLAAQLSTFPSRARVCDPTDSVGGSLRMMDGEKAKGAAAPSSVHRYAS